MTDRTDIMQRVLNLRELAGSSSSESEAMAAMKIADKMMTSYRIEEAELALAEGLGEIKVEIVDKYGELGQLNNGRNRHKVQSCIWSIENYCEVETVLKTGYSGQHYHVIGDKPDVELFEYLVALVKSALDREYNNWKRTQQAVGRGAKASFQLAMAGRINTRLRDMGHARNEERKAAVADAAKLLNKSEGEVQMAVDNGDLRELSSNVALVVVAAAEQKRAAVQDAYQSAYKNVRLGKASGFNYRGGNSAAAAGRSAGDRVHLGRAVGGGANKRLN